MEWAARGAALLLAAVAAGCVSPARAPAVVTPSAVGPASSPLPFIENDYAGALARAREAKLPLLVEVWAPW